MLKENGGYKTGHGGIVTQWIKHRASCIIHGSEASVYVIQLVTKKQKVLLI
jgi:hypothetical protein